MSRRPEINKDTFNPVSFLFGNVDASGMLENDIFEDNGVINWSNLEKLRLKSVVEEILTEKNTASYVANLNENSEHALVHHDLSSPDKVISSTSELDDVDHKAPKVDTSPNNTVEIKTNLNRPLASVMPSKYVGVDVKVLFPEFRPDKPVTFSKVLGCGKYGKTYSKWRSMKKRKLWEREEAAQKASLDSGEPIEWEIASDDEDKLLKSLPETHIDTNTNTNKEDVTQSNKVKTAPWRHGPAKMWYDLMNVPDDGIGFDYGFKLKSQSEQENKESRLNITEEPYPDEAFLMISQHQWEDDIIWKGDDVKNKVMKNWKKNCNAAGWLPCGNHRTFETCVKSHESSQSSKCGVGNRESRVNYVGKGTEKPDVDNTFYSIFPSENDELIYSAWEDDVIWDAEAMDKIPEPKILTLDPNDENIILGIPDDVEPNRNQKLNDDNQVKTKITHPHFKKSKLLLGKAGVINVLDEEIPPPRSKSPDRDPLYISNDSYYEPPYREYSLNNNSVSLIQHATPVVELQSPFIQTQMGVVRLRNFHRAPVKRFSRGLLSLPIPHPVFSLTRHIRRKKKGIERERKASGGGEIFFMRRAEDISGTDGEIILLEFSEEYPPLINQVGMCSKIKNYYKRVMGKDPGAPSFKYGEVAYVNSSTFLGVLPQGACQQVIENNLYRAPVYEHVIPKTDFLVIRTRERYFIRLFSALFLAGQTCPLYEVPAPNSKRATKFLRDFLQVFVCRLFCKSADDPKRIKMDDVKKAFPCYSENTLRKQLKKCADFKRTGNASNWWVIKSDFRLPSEEELSNIVSPEQCCAYFSMLAAEQRLKDAGYGGKSLFLVNNEDDDEDTQVKMDDEIKVAPWNTTRTFIKAMKGKCLLAVNGPADPTGCGEGFSYTRLPYKPTNKEEPEPQRKRAVMGTDADLRKLSLNNAKQILRDFQLPEEEIKKLSRWEIIDVIRTLSTEKVKAGKEKVMKFSRGNRFSVAEHHERHKEECQRIFELQNRVLSSNEVLSTDDEETPDMDEMGKNLEDMFLAGKTSLQLSREKEEQERQELREFVKLKNGNRNPPEDKKKNEMLLDESIEANRVLKIFRTFRDKDGKNYTRVEFVRNSSVIDTYVKVKTTGSEEFMNLVNETDEAQKEEMRREKKRIQDQIRRIKKNQERERLHLLEASRRRDTTLKTMDGIRPHYDTGDNVSKPLDMKSRQMKPNLKMTCGACGATGHMRTNRTCPKYKWLSNVAMTEEQILEMDKQLNNTENEEDLINLDGTKMKFSGRLIKHVEEVKRKSLLVKVPKEIIRRKRKKANEDDCDYLKKCKQSNRRPVDPVVVFSTILEGILNDMKKVPGIVPFLFPVNRKVASDYYRKIKNPMDLQTIRENIRQKRYDCRKSFLNDVNQIVENSMLFNGANSVLTTCAKELLQVCIVGFKKNEKEMIKLEKSINPLLDDDDSVAFSYVLKDVLEQLKMVPESWLFSKSPNRRMRKMEDQIKKFVDLETISKNVKARNYRSRKEFLADFELIMENAEIVNGKNSMYVVKARKTLEGVGNILAKYEEHLSVLENRMKLIKDEVILDSQEDAKSDAGDEVFADNGKREEMVMESSNDDDDMMMDVESVDIDFHDLRSMDLDLSTIFFPPATTVYESDDVIDSEQLISSLDLAQLKNLNDGMESYDGSSTSQEVPGQTFSLNLLCQDLDLSESDSD